MKLASFTMLRDEAAILDPFLDQLTELFDHSVVVDHMSSDASADLVRARTSLDLFHLESSGYPQEELATYFAHRVMESTDADWLFFLDCDEFLPFPDRRSLDAAMAALPPDVELATLRWRNILPDRLDGSDIFAGGFTSLPELAVWPKVILRRSLVTAHRSLKVSRGYHAVTGVPDDVRAQELSGDGLYHIPVQSKLSYASRMHLRGTTLVSGSSLQRSGTSQHWVQQYLELGQLGLDGFDFAGVALGYPAGAPHPRPEPQPVPFRFDYVRSSFREDPGAWIMQMYRSPWPTAPTGSLLRDDSGEIVHRFDEVETVETIETDAIRPPHADEEGLAPLGHVLAGPDAYGILVEPALSAAPRAAPLHSPLAGVIGVLVAALRPRSIVEVGVSDDSVAAAAGFATLERAVPSRVYSIDPWPEGRTMRGMGYEEFEANMTGLSSNVRVLRLEGREAASRFEPGSVELLWLTGFESGERIADAWDAWRHKLAPGATVVVEGIDSRAIGGGVPRFWSRLARDGTSLAIPVGRGVGILLAERNEQGGPRLLLDIAHDAAANDTYGRLLADLSMWTSTLALRTTEHEAGSRALERAEREHPGAASTSGADEPDDPDRSSELDLPAVIDPFSTTGPTLRDRQQLPPRDVDAYFIWPRGGNTGDLLIQQACHRFLRERGMSVWVSDGSVEAACLDNDHEYLRDAVGGFGGAVCFPGGGNIGRYPDNAHIRAAVIASLHPRSHCLVFSNSAAAPEPALRHDRVTVWCRDAESHRRLAADGVRTDLVPDMAFSMDGALPTYPGGEDAYLIRRDDAETVGHGVTIATRPYGMTIRAASDLTLRTPLPHVLAALSPYRLVVSDRLHGALVGALMGKEVVLLPVDYHKSRSLYDTWLSGHRRIRFADDAASLERAAPAASDGSEFSLRDLFREHADPAFDRFLDAVTGRPPHSTPGP